MRNTYGYEYILLITRLPGAASGCFMFSVTDTYNTSLAAKQKQPLSDLARLHELSKGGLVLGLAEVLRNQQVALFLIPVDSVLLLAFQLRYTIGVSLSCSYYYYFLKKLLLISAVLKS